MKHHQAVVCILVALIGIAVASRLAAAAAAAAAAGQEGANEETSFAQLRGERSRRAAAGDKNKENKPKKAKGKAGEFERACLESHNKWRRLHRADPLEFDEKIAVFARKRADFIAQSDGAEFRHPDDLVFGENLAWHSRNTTSCDDLIKMWYDEEPMYDYTKPKFSKEIGHFTQLVWRTTTKVGCARAYSSGPKGGIYLVCNYDPPGNWLGEFEENVLRAAQAGQQMPSSNARAITPIAPITTKAPASLSSPASTSVAPAASSTAASERPKKKKNKKNKSKKKKTNNSNNNNDNKKVKKNNEDEEANRKEKGNKKEIKRKMGRGRKNRKNSTTTTTTTTSPTTTP